MQKRAQLNKFLHAHQESHVTLPQQSTRLDNWDTARELVERNGDAFFCRLHGISNVVFVRHPNDLVAIMTSRSCLARLLCAGFSGSDDFVHLNMWDGNVALFTNVSCDVAVFLHQVNEWKHG